MRDNLATAISVYTHGGSRAGRGVVVDTTAGPGLVDVVTAGVVTPARLDTDLVVYTGETVAVTPSAAGMLCVTGVVSWRPTSGVAASTVDDTVQVRCGHPDLGGCTVTCRMSGAIKPGSPVVIVWTAAGPVSVPVNSAEPVQDPIAWDNDPGMPDTVTVPEPDVPEPSEVGVRPSWWTGESNVGSAVTSGLRLSPDQNVVLRYEMPPIDWAGRVTLTVQRTREGSSPSPIIIKLADVNAAGKTTILDMDVKTGPMSPGETLFFDMPQDMAQVLTSGAVNSLALSAAQPLLIESPAVNISSGVLTFIKES